MAAVMIDVPMIDVYEMFPAIKRIDSFFSDDYDRRGIFRISVRLGYNSFT